MSDNDAFVVLLQDKARHIAVEWITHINTRHLLIELRAGVVGELIVWLSEDILNLLQS